MAKGRQSVVRRNKRSRSIRSIKRAAKRSKTEFLFHELPEGIICDVVSRLALKDAVRAGLVSTKWKQLWTCHPNLCFDSRTMLNRKFGSRHRTRRQRFIRHVNTVLQRHSGIGLKSFKIEFAFDRTHTEHLDRWLSFALSSKASDVVLDLLPKQYYFPSMPLEDAYALPFHLFNRQSASHIESLQLVYVLVKPSLDFCAFTGLRVLDLRYVHVLGDLEKLLSKCNALERLSIARCYPLLKLKLEQPSHRLRHLSVQECSLHSIEFDATNLETFKYSGQAVPIVLGESVKLKVASITLLEEKDTLEHVVTELSGTLPHVEALGVSIHVDTQMVGLLKCQRKFVHFRELELTAYICGDRRKGNGIFRLAYLLEMAPLLEILELNMASRLSPVVTPADFPLQRVPPCTHNHLRRVDISGFLCLKGQLQLVWYILDNAVALKRMTIDASEREKYFTASDMETSNARDYASKYLALEELTYPHVQIVIL